MTKERTITVPLELSASDIKYFASLYNDTEDSELHEYVEMILKKCNEVSFELKETTSQIMDVNPFSQF